MRARGIPTRYAGTVFRSRLESRWAAFFTELSLPWIYEPPTDAIVKGWLPDFLLGQILVECKPALTLAALAPACHKAERSGYQGHVVVLGISPQIGLSANVKGQGTIWRPVRWSRDVRLAWALAGNQIQWRKKTPS